MAQRQMLNKAGRNRLIAGLYLTVQIGVPLGALLTGSPYFGWRMFSEVRFPPQVVLTRTKSVDTVSVTRYVGFPRGDMSYGPNVAIQICHLVTDAITVRVLPSSGPAQAVKCR
jgi:hypothetical protein